MKRTRKVYFCWSYRWTFLVGVSHQPATKYVGANTYIHLGPGMFGIWWEL